MDEVEKSHLSKPNVGKQAQKHLDEAEKKFDKYNEELKSLSHDIVRSAPLKEEEAQTKLSSREVAKNNDLYLKPDKTMPDMQKFNEIFQKEWEFQSEYVNFIAEHKELIGETIEMWTHPFGGKGACFWKVPTNKPVWGPRYLAEQIKKRRYVRFKTDERRHTSSDGTGTFYGAMVAETVVQRMDANPVSSHKSVFMGSGGF